MTCTGYLLDEEECEGAAQTFLERSTHLRECLAASRRGRKFNTEVFGFTLVDLLDEYCSVNAFLDEQSDRLALDLPKEGGVVGKLQFLVESCRSAPPALTNGTTSPHHPQQHWAETQHRKHRRRTFLPWCHDQSTDSPLYHRSLPSNTSTPVPLVSPAPSANSFLSAPSLAASDMEHRTSLSHMEVTDPRVELSCVPSVSVDKVPLQNSGTRALFNNVANKSASSIVTDKVQTQTSDRDPVIPVDPNATSGSDREVSRNTCSALPREPAGTKGMPEKDEHSSAESSGCSPPHYEWDRGETSGDETPQKRNVVGVAVESERKADVREAEQSQSVPDGPAVVASSKAVASDQASAVECKRTLTRVTKKSPTSLSSQVCSTNIAASTTVAVSPTKALALNVEKVKTTPSASMKRTMPAAVEHRSGSSNSILATPTKLTDKLFSVDDDDSYDVAFSVFSRALDNHELHERMADNINRVMSKPSAAATTAAVPTVCDGMARELNQAIKTVVSQTERDPSFEKILDEILGNSVKKCRARYGMGQKRQWCKPCRTKQKCVRYTEAGDNCNELRKTQKNTDT